MATMRNFEIIPPESPQGFGVRWLAGNGADTALEFMARVQAKAVCALAPHPPHSKALARDAVHGLEARPRLEVEAPMNLVAADVRRLCAARKKSEPDAEYSSTFAENLAISAIGVSGHLENHAAGL